MRFKTLFPGLNILLFVLDLMFDGMPLAEHAHANLFDTGRSQIAWLHHHTSAVSCRDLMTLRCENSYSHRAVFQDVRRARPDDALYTFLECRLAIMLTWQPSGVGEEISKKVESPKRQLKSQPL